MNPASIQTDRRFSYLPPDFTQPTQALPNAWNPNAIGTSEAQFTIPAPNNQPVMPETDTSYFMQSGAFSFGPHVFSNNGFDTEMRHGSLSQQQQVELMQSLETDGLTEIDNFMTLNTQQLYDTPIKFVSNGIS